MKVVIFAKLPIAGAPFLQYQCLKKYTDLDIRCVHKVYKYGDGRVFPYDLLLTDPEAHQVLREADVVHVHNYLPQELYKYINKSRQRIIATFHSVPRLGNWAELMRYAHQSYSIRQPMQMREYDGVPTLPNLFDTWGVKVNYLHLPPLNIVYCPTNRLAPTSPGSKAYSLVMPVLQSIQREYGKEVNIIHHSGVEYYENLRRKSEGHITIDDLVGGTFHLTSLEACATGQAVMNNVTDGYPFMSTTPQTLKHNLDRLLNDTTLMFEYMVKSREWMEAHWNPVEMVKEYTTAYGG